MRSDRVGGGSCHAPGWVFLINIPIAIAVILSLWHVPERAARTRGVDGRAHLAALLGRASFRADRGDARASDCGSVTDAVGSLVRAFLVESRSNDPMLPRELSLAHFAARFAHAFSLNALGVTCLYLENLFRCRLHTD